MTEDLVSLILNLVTQLLSATFHFFSVFHATQVWICHGPLQHRRQITDHQNKIHQSIIKYLEVQS